MTINKALLIILVSSLFLRFFLIYINFQTPNFAFLQENYDVYINALKDGSISNPNFNVYETRMFPGYTLALLPFTFILNDVIAIGIVLNLILFSISFYLVWKIFRNIFINFLFSFFPPVWITQSTKASSEPLTVALLLSSLFAYVNKYYFLAGLIVGIAFNVRIISSCLFLAIFLILLMERKIHQAFRVSLGFMAGALFLVLYNYLVFGQNNLLIQFTNLSENYQAVTIGFTQIFYDIARTIDWGQYKILFSGLFYLVLNFFALALLFKFRNDSNLIKISFYWVLFSLIFIFSLSPFTIIENFARYAVPVALPVCVAIDLFVKLLEEKSSSLPQKPKFSADEKRMETHK